ncbi:MAG: DUF4186 domain-containing protein [Planctomycetota bacterium]|jgi:hypothetical protein
MRDLDDLFSALGRSTFRSRFRLGPKERAYLQEKTLPVILQHGRQFVADRLAPAQPASDGRQTPMRGHPVFIAQHATATCCRGCLAKWHYIGKGKPLSDEQIEYVLDVIRSWLRDQGTGDEPAPRVSRLE